MAGALTIGQGTEVGARRGRGAQAWALHPEAPCPGKALRQHLAHGAPSILHVTPENATQSEPIRVVNPRQTYEQEAFPLQWVTAALCTPNLGFQLTSAQHPPWQTFGFSRLGRVPPPVSPSASRPPAQQDARQRSAGHTPLGARPPPAAAPHSETTLGGLGRSPSWPVVQDRAHLLSPAPCSLCTLPPAQGLGTSWFNQLVNLHLRFGQTR